MQDRSAQQIWETALGELELQVSRPNYRTWLANTRGLSYKDGQFIIGVPNTFVAEYLDKNQRSLIEKTLMGLTGRQLAAHFHVASGNPIPDYRFTPPGNRAAQSLSMFNPNYTFDSFVTGNNNRLAKEAALMVVENLGHIYNPLFIYGGTGLGKTHLLQAIGQAALARNIIGLYASAEQFTNEYVTAIRERSTESFRDKYRSADMLLVDDIQFIGGKEQTEEGFFHTFDELRNSNRQIVITSDCKPKSMPLLQERLRSRFEWGLIADIQPPDLETRLAILRAKAKTKNTDIHADVLEFIATRAKDNIRELEGSLNRVIAYSRLLRAPVTTELALHALGDIATNDSQKPAVNPVEILEAVANTFQLAVSDLKGRKRDKQTTLARHIAMYLIRSHTGCSLTETGRELGGRDTSTVIHGCAKIARDIDESPSLKRQITEIQQICLKRNPHK
ncbi:MAG: chromosomal replication initiator protein DnaA [Chloroflexi bacterium]|nr:chromosomal replication initiator protein DnaA [Chloroflexota bacterium]